MFQDEMALYLDDHFRLGRYLSPSIDVGPTFTAKIIKEHSQVLHRSTYCALTQEEWKEEECKQEYSSFMESIHLRFGPHAMVRDQVELSVEDTP